MIRCASTCAPPIAVSSSQPRSLPLQSTTTTTNQVCINFIGLILGFAPLGSDDPLQLLETHPRFKLSPPFLHASASSLMARQFILLHHSLPRSSERPPRIRLPLSGLQLFSCLPHLKPHADYGNNATNPLHHIDKNVFKHFQIQKEVPVCQRSSRDPAPFHLDLRLISPSNGSNIGHKPC